VDELVSYDEGARGDATVEGVCAHFDRRYAARSGYFGGRPSLRLLRYCPEDGAGLRALDLGSGPGRNALHLARLGYDVTAVDYAQAAVRELRGRAEAEGLALRAVCADLHDYELPAGAYDVVVAVTVLGLLERAVLPTLARRVVASVRPGGVLLVEEFGTSDPGRQRRGDASEFAPLIRRYFTPGELRCTFSPLEVIACHEFMVTDTTHGVPHVHGLVRYVGRRRPDRAADGREELPWD
jgi:cyclopropane fatty-acyl-phospholipid synthase-like methyltransferase